MTDVIFKNSNNQFLTLDPKKSIPVILSFAFFNVTGIIINVARVNETDYFSAVYIKYIGGYFYKAFR